MSKFRVLGGKSISYYTTVEASDKYEAYEIANNLPADQWNEIETDDVIEAVEVYDEENDVEA